MFYHKKRIYKMYAIIENFTNGYFQTSMWPSWKEFRRQISLEIDDTTWSASSPALVRLALSFFFLSPGNFVGQMSWGWQRDEK